VPRWSPINGSLQKLKPENYHLHNGMLLVQRKMSTGLAEETNSLPHNLKTIWQDPKSE